ncbi:MAG TPA: hypothetical protein ENI23_13190 [bacterium]|nr:hypothetical protein [bacterium]
MIIECQTCGCAYRINVDDDEDKKECDVTAELVECVMCFKGKEPICINTVKKTDKIPSPYRLRECALSKKADKIIRDNYKEKIDKELVKIIKDELGEKYTYAQTKARRKYLGLIKGKGWLKKQKYTDVHFDFLRENVDEDRIELNKKFNEHFSMNISIYAMNQQMSQHGIKRIKKPLVPKPVKLIDPHQKSIDEKKKIKMKGMTKEAIKIIEENYMEKTDDELRELIADQTGNFHNTNRIAKYRETNAMSRPKGWKPKEIIVDDEDLE